MQITVKSAQAELPRLIEAALKGQDVVIADDAEDAVRLVPVSRKPFRFGLLEGILTGPGPDFLKPLSEDELAAWEGER